LLGLAAASNYRDLAAARERKQALEVQIRQTRAENDELARRIERLRNDPATLERLAREQYRMMRPDDLVIVMPEDSEAAQPMESVPTSEAVAPPPPSTPSEG
jgi:cell division protein FtsB